MRYFVPAAEHLRNDTGLPITSAELPPVTAIQVRDLRKSYGGHAAVRGVSLEIAEGEVYALLGHNGAGKSTIVEILEGHRTPRRGRGHRARRRPGRGGRAFRDRIGIVLQTSGVETELTVREAIELYGIGVSPAAAGRRGDRAGRARRQGRRRGSTRLSGGQQRRLDLALGIVGHPEVLFLDEPTTGFDAAARRKSWELIAELCRARHDRAADDALPRRGRAPRRPGRRAVPRRARRRGHARRADRPAGRHRRVVHRRSAPNSTRSTACCRGRVPQRPAASSSPSTDPTRDVHAVTGWAIERGVRLDALSVSRPTLEDVFLGLADVELAAERCRCRCRGAGVSDVAGRGRR